uniref:Matrix Gla protein n=1 Tax=Anas platyrhynchos TaxID=8839 RepID=A0A8B9SHT4_ANAPL
MRTLIILTLLATLIMAATCYESHESMESHEYLNPFINRRRANGFMQTDMRLEAIAQERIRERNKAPQERQREICEDYYPCELLPGPDVSWPKGRALFWSSDTGTQARALISPGYHRNIKCCLKASSREPRYPPGTLCVKEE